MKLHEGGVRKDQRQWADQPNSYREFDGTGDGVKTQSRGEVRKEPASQER